MTCDDIPKGWRYAGNNFNGKANSYEEKYMADGEADRLRKSFPNRDFDTFKHNDRWIIIVKKDNGYEIFRKKSVKRNKCKCRK